MFCNTNSAYSCVVLKRHVLKEGPSRFTASHCFTIHYTDYKRMKDVLKELHSPWIRRHYTGFTMDACTARLPHLHGSWWMQVSIGSRTSVHWAGIHSANTSTEKQAITTPVGKADTLVKDIYETKTQVRDRELMVSKPDSLRETRKTPYFPPLIPTLFFSVSHEKKLPLRPTWIVNGWRLRIHGQQQTADGLTINYRRLFLNY